MNLLLTNDDGFTAEGINILARRLAVDNNVYIIAPDSNRSAVSQHITLTQPLNLIRVADNTYSCSGYPVDCVTVGIQSSLLGVKIDGIVSGINCGANMGTDILYSGTCAAARQSVLNGIPSIAVSVEFINPKNRKNEKLKYDAVADFVAKNLKKLFSLAKTEPPRAFVNINALSLDSYKGAKICKDLCIRNYGDSVAAVHDKDDRYHADYVMGNGNTPCLPGTDLTAIKEGYIAVSLVCADPVGLESVDDMDFSL